MGPFCYRKSNPIHKLTDPIQTGLPTGILKCQITQIWHFSKAFGSEKLALAVWHIFGIIFTILAVKFLDWQ